METKISKGRGRPKLGNVLFARRVAPGKVQELLATLSRDVVTRADQIQAVESDQSLMWKKAFDQSEIEIDRLRKQIESNKIIKSDNEVVAALSSENAKLKAKVKEYEQMYG